MSYLSVTKANHFRKASSPVKATTPHVSIKQLKAEKVKAENLRLKQEEEERAKEREEKRLEEDKRRQEAKIAANSYQETKEKTSCTCQIIGTANYNSNDNKGDDDNRKISNGDDNNDDNGRQRRYPILINHHHHHFHSLF